MRLQTWQVCACRGQQSPRGSDWVNAYQACVLSVYTMYITSDAYFSKEEIRCNGGCIMNYVADPRLTWQEPGACRALHKAHERYII